MKKSLTRNERLSGKRDIDALFENANRYEGRIVRLLVRPNGLERNRILVTARRGFSSAPARNRQKRILREIYRNGKQNLKRGFDLAFILVKEGSGFDEVRDALERLYRRAALYSQ